MYTQISAETMTNQKLNEFHKQAEQNRLLDLAATEGQERSKFAGGFLSWILSKLGIQFDRLEMHTDQPG